MTRPCPDLDLDLEWDLEWDLELDHNHLGAKCQKTEYSGFLQYFLKKKYFFTRLLASYRVPSLSFNLVERKGQDVHTQSYTNSSPIMLSVWQTLSRIGLV